MAQGEGTSTESLVRSTIKTYSSKPSSHRSILQRVLQPINFSEAGNAAFVHALVVAALIVALIAKAKLINLHVWGRRGGSWTDFPGVCEPWSVWPASKKQRASRCDKIRVRGSEGAESSRRPRQVHMAYLDEQGTDLIVLVIDQLKNWLHRSLRPAPKNMKEN